MAINISLAIDITLLLPAGTLQTLRRIAAGQPPDYAPLRHNIQIRLATPPPMASHAIEAATPAMLRHTLLPPPRMIINSRTNRYNSRHYAALPLAIPPLPNIAPTYETILPAITRSATPDDAMSTERQTQTILAAECRVLRERYATPPPSLAAIDTTPASAPPLSRQLMPPPPRYASRHAAANIAR